jgi:hypothetical protein
MKVGDGTVWTVCITQFSSKLLLMLAVLTTSVSLFCRDNIDTNSDRPWAKGFLIVLMIDVVYNGLGNRKKNPCVYQ